MSTRLHVSNLSNDTTENDLHNLFNRSGLVMSVTIATDERTGASRNFGYVDMSTPEAAETAIRTLNGQMLRHQALQVTAQK